MRDYRIMVADACGEISSPGISPRISFSYDLDGDGDGENGSRTKEVPFHDCDFHFCFSDSHGSFFDEVSSADELFAGGQILPLKTSQFAGIRLRESEEIVPAINSHPSKDVTPCLRQGSCEDQGTKKKKLLKEFLSMSVEEVGEQSNVSKSFRLFKRSYSFNNDIYSKSKEILRSLQFLPRSHSTGSAPNPRRRSFSGPENQKMSPRQCFMSGPISLFPNTTPLQKTPPGLRKCGSYGRIRVGPVLNVVPPHITVGAVNLSGCSSLFCSGKERRKKRHD